MSEEIKLERQMRIRLQRFKYYVKNFVFYFRRKGEVLKGFSGEVSICVFEKDYFGKVLQVQRIF